MSNEANLRSIAEKTTQNATGTVVDMMSAIDRGAFINTVEDAMRDLVLACDDLQKPGEITLTVKLKPQPDTGSMLVTGTVKTKLPQRSPRASIFFANTDGHLTRHDQRQPDMFIDNNR